MDDIKNNTIWVIMTVIITVKWNKKMINASFIDGAG